MSWKTLKHQGSRRIKKALFALRSSFIVYPKIKPQRPFGSTIIHQFKIKSRRPLKRVFFVYPKIKPQRPFGSTIIHQFKIKPRRPLKRVFFVIRSSFFQDQAPTALGSNPPSRSSPKALEDPFITVLQDQTQKPLKICSSPLFKPQTALEETLILKIKPQRLLEDPLKSTFKDQAHDP
ncbi:hypothetical protein COP2_042598 [Malus domestica]